MNMWVLLFVLCAFGVNGKLDEDDEQGSSGDQDLDESIERIGATVTQVYEHPYAASLNKNDTYICSAIVLNTYWLLTLSKCFDSAMQLQAKRSAHVSTNDSANIESIEHAEGHNVSPLMTLEPVYLNNTRIEETSIHAANVHVTHAEMPLDEHNNVSPNNNINESIVTSYVTHKNLGNFTVRVGSSYNNKAGALHKIKMMINNFDHYVTAVKLETPMEFSSRVQSVRLPGPDDEITLGFLASIVAWTPNGHMRVVNAPIIDPTICEVDTKMLPGHYVCVGGVQDPNRHFCRKDNGGAVIQNNTLVAISSFINACALYSKTHSFPKIASFVHWLDSVIWDEVIKPSSTTEPPTNTPTTTSKMPNNANATKEVSERQPYYADIGKYMLTLPYDPINVPIEPSEDNSVLPGMSLYESYLQSIVRAKTSTTASTDTVKQKTDSTKASNQSMMISQHIYARMPKKYDRVWY